MTVKGAAAAAATAIVPEAAVPAQLLAAAIKRSRAPKPPTETVVVQPSDHAQLLKLGKDKIRVRTVGGVRVVTVDRGRGLTAGELALLAAAGATILAGYEAYKTLKSFETTVSSPPTLNLGPLGKVTL